jgi:DNA-binding NtrC family response regulator
VLDHLKEGAMVGPIQTPPHKVLQKNKLNFGTGGGISGTERVSRPKEDRSGPDAPPVTLLVAKLSEAFGDLWSDLGLDLGIEIQPVADADPLRVPIGAAAIVLAAGGAERDALEWLDRHALPPSVRVLVVGSDPSRRTAAHVVRRGATDYFALPEDLEVLRNALAAAVARQRERLKRTQPQPEGDLEAFATIIGGSPALRVVLERAARIIPHPTATALIVGETGTGKELLARAIHEGGPRRGAAFVPVNCSALPRHLIESELFGHERGAFTDAHAAKPGLFEVAHGGTLFLDEIGSLPVELQAKLLRALEDHEIRRVGSTKSRKVDVRILAATNENLSEAVKSGAFRQDLFFRLGAVRLVLPPLRERGNDVVLVAEKLLGALARQYGLPMPPLTAEARHLLLGYSWPGNVRELKNAVERSLLLSRPGELNLAELLPAAELPAQTEALLPFPAPLDAITCAAARAMVDLCQGNISEAARRLRVSRTRLRRLLELNATS